MQATKQQQIVVYFIEEAKEHLDTIEQGLLNLQDTMADSERMNELFRAAHSVKGGAAMLGFNSIQKVGHHLEDSFKLLKEHPLTIDQRLEDLFLQGFDILKGLVEELQSPYGVREQDAEKVLQAAEPMFTELQNYLNCLIENRGKPSACQTIPSTQQATQKVDPKLPALLNGGLKKMLELFKQGDTPTSRQQLATLCVRMVQLHSSHEWQELLQTAQAAIRNSKNSYQRLAPLVIKELKQAGDLLIVGRASEITPSSTLQQIAACAQVASLKSPAIPKVAAIASAPQTLVHEITTKPQQIMVPVEPRAAARALLDAFNKEQLIELAEFLMKAIQ